ncbi:hypothetical protein R6L23_08205 [Streptomyces sp. SR27]|uniref:hypothetical protein n=1 Tax=Streptomyces sp. SR27 TaxID=3076630 RepID=UPI00295BD6B3|nr:hypothetical protein [Streptomyces sp. SR27]MDV9188197.1 hypothetical protein [Streptomyces sp. SR27]
MRASVRRSIQALLDGVDTVAMLAGAVSGAVVGYTYYPATLDAALRLPAAGAVALGGALVFTTAVDAALAPLRRRFAQADVAEMRDAAEARAAGARGAAVPSNLSEALDQVAAAAENDAAHRAAQAAYRIDLSNVLLNNTARWRGYTTGEATYYFAPGAVLHYRREEERSIPEPHYTLLTADDPNPVPITNVAQIFEELALRARKTAEAAGAGVPSTV